MLTYFLGRAFRVATPLRTERGYCRVCTSGEPMETRSHQLPQGCFMNDTLLTLANEVRNKTLWLLDGVNDDMAHFAAPGLTNSILWHAGHALVVVEHLAVAPATGQLPQLPDGWFEIFSWDSNPLTVKHWPAVADVKGALREQLPRLTGAITTLSSAQLAQVLDQTSGTTLHYDILHALHDEANHQGEMWVLRKMHAKQRPLIS
jgi:DinB family protein